jgi:hypothetical protein
MTEPSDESDVKALLGRALSGEPPLTLDRDEVFRQGRRKLRVRRMFSTGGAIGGAVVAVVGAVMLTGLIADEPAPEENPPAASRTEHPAPPGPTLPLTTTEVPPTVRAPLSEQHARTLSHDFLMNNDALPNTVQMFRPDGESVQFTVGKDTYELRLDVRLPPAEGNLSVSIGTADPGRVANCKDVPDAKYGCTVRKVRGVHVAVGTWKGYGTGEKRYIAFAVRPDGTSVTAVATNLSDTRRNQGALPSTKTPVLDQDVLARLVTMPALRYEG